LRSVQGKPKRIRRYFVRLLSLCIVVRRVQYSHYGASLGEAEIQTTCRLSAERRFLARANSFLASRPAVAAKLHHLFLRGAKGRKRFTEPSQSQSTCWEFMMYWTVVGCCVARRLQCSHCGRQIAQLIPARRL